MKISKGALAMVVAGAVTFSVANSLLVDPVTKRGPLPRLADIIKQPLMMNKIVAEAKGKESKPETAHKASDRVETSAIKSERAAAPKEPKQKESVKVTVTDAVNTAEPAARKTAAQTASAAASNAPAKAASAEPPAARGPETTAVKTPPVKEAPEPVKDTPVPVRKPASTPAATKPPAEPAQPPVKTAPVTAVKKPVVTEAKPAETKRAAASVRGQQASTAAKEKAAVRQAEKETKGKDM
ncbi:hypothetical protein V1498_02705 [Peribacillus sp. SCS-26]|uniref:hypothetical protein n=1 Tax=Paraperibacillus marinus TaxID=3115295 RepID=UPI00390655DF